MKQNCLEKILIVIILIIILPKFVYGFYYEYLFSINKNNFVINLKNFENNIYLLCKWQNFECQHIDKKDVMKSENNYFYTQDYESFIYQIKTKNSFLTFYQEKQTLPKLLSFNKKINKVFFSQDKQKVIFETNKVYYLFDLNKNSVVKKFTLNKNGFYITISPNLSYLALYQIKSLNTGEKKFFIYDLENSNWKNFLSIKHTYWDILAENNKLFEFLDENNLIFLSDHENFQKLYLYDIQKDKIVDFLKENFIVKDFKIYKTKLFFTANRENSLKWDLYEYDFSTQTIRKIFDYVAYDFELSVFKNFLIFKSAGELPPRINLLNLDNHQIIRPKVNFISEKINLGEPRNYNGNWFVILKPDNFDYQKNYDLIIYLHGGPYRQTSIGYHPYFSYGFYDYLFKKLRQNNYLIIKMDYPGSLGYGKNYAESLKENIGKVDVQAVIDIYNEIRQEFKINKAFLMGNSYGGYLALKTLYEHPDLFEGTISINGVTDWYDLIRNSPSSIFKIHFNGPPSKNNIYLYDQASIFLHKENLKNKKILIINGNYDSTIPQRQKNLFIEKYKNIAKIMDYSFNETHILEKSQTFNQLYFLILAFTKI